MNESPQNIFITGASGCVGHYLLDLLAGNPRYKLYLFIRDASKLKFDYHSFPNINIITDDLQNIGKYSQVLKQMDYLIHLAASWGGADKVNHEYTLTLFNLLSPAKIKKAIYFSTTSILRSDGQLLPEALSSDLPYIQEKALCYQSLPTLKIHDRIITLFPTLIVGGDRKHPPSHINKGLTQVIKRLNVARFFKYDLSFHFIHAKDLGLITKYILENDLPRSSFILGNKLTTLNHFIKELCHLLNKRIFFQITIRPSFIEFLADLTGRKLFRWDRFCLRKKSWDYETVNATYFGISSNLQTPREIIRNYLEEETKATIS